MLRQDCVGGEKGSGRQGNAMMTICVERYVFQMRRYPNELCFSLHPHGLQDIVCLTVPRMRRIAIQDLVRRDSEQI